MIKYVKWFFKLFPTIIYLCHINNKFYKNPKKHSRLVRFNSYKKVAKKGIEKMNIDLYVEGENHFPCEQSYLLTPNHQSMFDIVPIIHTHLDPIAFISKKSLKKAPIAGKGIKSIESLFLDREDLKSEIKIMKKMALSMRSENLKWCIFPEGTRTKNSDLSLNEFKPGAFKFPQKEGVTIIPVAIYGTHRLLDKKIHLKRYPIYISYLKPILKEDYKDMSTQELSLYVRDSIQTKIDEFKKIDEEILKKQKK